MKLFNTLSRTIEDFEPLNAPKVTFYSCGPTVYDFTHIGHLRTFVNNDILKRVLIYAGYHVKHVMNITDVGHLTGDDDTGEDKLEKGAKLQKKTVWEIAEFYTRQFNKSLTEINISPADILCKATDHITDMINLIQRLQNKGVTYETDQAIYFDITKSANYGRLSGQKLSEKNIGSRDEVYADPDKKNSADFALWFKRLGRFKNHTMHWDSPWGPGFPGWHIECSAMSMKYLGDTIDIHSGGIDHIAVHHENEIAQSETATGKLFVRLWFHNAFLLVDGEKMSKSKKNFYTLDDLKKKDYDPLALRYLYLLTHYQKPLNFTWEAITAAQNALFSLRNLVLTLKQGVNRHNLYPEKLKKTLDYQKRFDEALFENLQLPQALAVIFEALKSNIPSSDKLDLVYNLDQITGLALYHVEPDVIPQQVTKLAEKRELARRQGDFDMADDLRAEIEKLGYMIEDVKSGFVLKKIKT